MLISQISEDVIVLEATIDNTKTIIASMYLDITRQTDIDILKIEAIIAYAKGEAVIIAMDSNCRSTSWHDSLTNRKGELLEEYLKSKQLNIINEESSLTNFNGGRGTSNIDITITNNQTR